MNQVHSSSLSKVKSVFSNEDENVFFYEKLRDICGTVFLNVEFAEPVLNQSAGVIVWKAIADSPYDNFTNLSDIQKEHVGGQIKEAFEKFQEQTASLSRQSGDFQRKFLEVPSENSIYVNLEKDQIIITEWGFLLNQLNPPSKIMEHLFPADEYSIVVELLSSNGNPLVAHSLRLNSNQGTSVDKTDDKGLARLGQVLRGESFTISSDSNAFPSQVFVSKRTNKYTIIVPEYVHINLRVKNGDGTPVAGTRFKFKSEELGVIDFATDELGECTIRHLKANQLFSISDNAGRQLHTSEIPNNDVDVEIVLDNLESEANPPSIPEIEENNEEEFKEDVVVKFKTWFGRPKKQLPVSVGKRDEAESSDFLTDDKGQIYLGLDHKQVYSVGFSSFGEPWNHLLTHDKDVAVHTIGIRPIFPWLWWLLILLLLILLYSCLFDNCLCNHIGGLRNGTEAVTERIRGNDFHDGPSMEERRNIHGGQTGEVTISLAWNTADDLDLIVTDPLGETIYFRNPISSSGGQLDVDMNRSIASDHPIENIVWPAGSAPKGIYLVQVLCYQKRDQFTEGAKCKVEVNMAGQLTEQILSIPPQSRDVPVVVGEFRF
jgi:hypothetical protein